MDVDGRVQCLSVNRTGGVRCDVKMYRLAKKKKKQAAEKLCNFTVFLTSLSGKCPDKQR